MMVKLVGDGGDPSEGGVPPSLFTASYSDISHAPMAPACHHRMEQFRRSGSGRPLRPDNARTATAMVGVLRVKLREVTLSIEDSTVSRSPHDIFPVSVRSSRIGSDG